MHIQHCLIITDDKIGNINPAKGLAQELAHYYTMEIHSLSLTTSFVLRYLPFAVIKNIPFLKRSLLKTHLAHLLDYPEHFPQIIIGNGHLSITICALLRLYAKEHKIKCFFIQMQNPRIHPHYFDAVIPPFHDGVKGDNVISTIGSLTQISRDKIDKSIIPYEILNLPGPVVSVFIGGKNSRYRFNVQDAERMATELKIFMTKNKCSLAITTSRRTGKKQSRILRHMLQSPNIYFWNQKGDNPYFAFLRHTKIAIVTSDSVNMISEIASAGLNIILYPMHGKPSKFQHFYNALARRGYLQYFNMDPYIQKVPPLSETQRVASILNIKIKEFFNNA